MLLLAIKELFINTPDRAERIQNLLSDEDLSLLHVKQNYAPPPKNARGIPSKKEN